MLDVTVSHGVTLAAQRNDNLGLAAAVVHHRKFSQSFALHFSYPAIIELSQSATPSATSVIASHVQNWRPFTQLTFV